MLGLDEINRRGTAQLRTVLEGREKLEKVGVFDVLTDYHESFSTLQQLLAPTSTHPRARSRAVRRTASMYLEHSDGLAFRSEGPLWYRGASLDNEALERDQIARVAELLEAERIFVGHTPTRQKEITTRFEGRLVRLDVGATYGNDLQAAEIAGDEIRIFDAQRGQFQAVFVQPPQGESWARGIEELPDSRVAELLSSAKIKRARPLGRGSTRPLLVQLTESRTRLRGIFKSVEEKLPKNDDGCPEKPVDRYQHEIAAYRLDRLLGLGMVPVTVSRMVDGKRGSLQLWLEEAIDRKAREAYGLDVAHPELMPPQYAREKIFDALIGNPDRGRSDELFILGESRLLLIDHSKAFCAAFDPEIEGRLPSPCRIDPMLRQSLESLDATTLSRELGRLLNRGQRKAILDRRDTILRLCPAGTDAASTQLLAPSRVE